MPKASGVGPAFAAIALGALVAGCADRLPDQDLRILQATPVAKLSTDILWKEYEADAPAADRKYWGEAIEISGRVSSVVSEPPARVIFLPANDSNAGVEARLLDERAQEALASAKAGERITLKCFCEGRQTNVVLKSCMKPY